MGMQKERNQIMRLIEEKGKHKQIKGKNITMGKRVLTKSSK